MKLIKSSFGFLVDTDAFLAFYYYRRLQQIIVYSGEKPMLQTTMALLQDRHVFFLELLAEHIKISFLAIWLAIIIGLCLGIFISKYENTSKFVLNLVNFIYTIPSISLLGFLIPLSGIGNTTAVIALTVYALLPMVRNTHTGIITINPAIVEAARGMGSTENQILWKIQLPLALPTIMSGIRSLATMTIALAGIASFVGAGGLGIAIYRGITTNNTAMTIAGSLLIALLAIIVDSFFGIMENILNLRHHYSHRKVLVTLMGAILLLPSIGFFSLPTQQVKSGVIHIATKPMTEQYILGEMLKELIEQETKLKVILTQGVGGGTANIEPAMEAGKFDLYPEYTGTGWNMVLKEKTLYSEQQFPQLQAAYEAKLNLTWQVMYGFNNTYGLVLQQEIADKYNIRSYSELAKIAPLLTFGAEPDFFDREDGYNALCQKYNLHFKDTVSLDIGLKYQALKEKKIDIMNIFTTDGQLSVAEARVLLDDQHFYPSYRCGNVIRLAVLRQHPELLKVLAKLDNTITDENMAAMNYAVETNKQDPKDVAHKFLQTAGLIQQRE